MSTCVVTLLGSKTTTKTLHTNVSSAQFRDLVILESEFLFQGVTLVKGKEGGGWEGGGLP